MAEAELATIARPYARAAFAYAVEQNKGLDVWSGVLAALASAVEQNVIREKLSDPLLTRQEGAGVLIKLFDSQLNENVRNFISVLAEYGRIELLPEIMKLFELMKANYEKTVNVDVTSAFEMSDNEASQLSESMQDYLQRNIKLTTNIDESLLGGIVVCAEDTVIDHSIRGRLRKLSQTLSQTGPE